MFGHCREIWIVVKYSFRSPDDLYVSRVVCLQCSCPQVPLTCNKNESHHAKNILFVAKILHTNYSVYTSNIQINVHRPRKKLILPPRDMPFVGLKVDLLILVMAFWCFKYDQEVQRTPCITCQAMWQLMQNPKDKQLL